MNKLLIFSALLAITIAGEDDMCHLINVSSIEDGDDIISNGVL